MATLFTRPRRFGKSLALSMLRTFFEVEIVRETRRDLLDRLDKHPVRDVEGSIINR